MYISDFFIFGKLTEWHCFVTYLSNDPRIKLEIKTSESMCKSEVRIKCESAVLLLAVPSTTQQVII